MTKKLVKPLQMVENTEKNIKFKCELCKGTTPHLICIMNKDGAVHVHGPIENRELMQDFIAAIIKELK